MKMLFFFLLILNGGFQGISCYGSSIIPTGNKVDVFRKKEDGSTCPMYIDMLRKFVAKNDIALRFVDIQTECRTLLECPRIVRADYLARTGSFTFPANASESCWDAYESLVKDYVEGSFAVRRICGVQNQWISNSCRNVSTKSDFEALVPESQLQEINKFCNHSLNDNSSCVPCDAILSKIALAYFHSPEIDNASDCGGFPYMYAAAFVNQFGPTDLGTIKCLFKIDYSLGLKVANQKHQGIKRGVLIGSATALILVILVIWLLLRQRNKHWTGKDRLQSAVTSKEFGLELLSEGMSLARFNIDELRQATGNFSWENLIGRGAYGNVYRAVLSDGSEVALKRFKNCSVAGDSTFVHEVEVIASVRHVNIMALMGFCIATTPLEGHQRIIVCDFIRNGSMHDHLFSSNATRLSWPVRRKIALGVARGLSYLHNGVQPAIVHRDVKASNILLDESFEPKLADFGLAKFTPDGISHFSTRVAGTLGYVSPEYAVYGQLSEKSDVYSFGVVLLELLSGKKAVISFSNGQAQLLTDWAWSLVREGRALNIIEENMPEMDTSEVMEKYVLAATLSVHPLLHARPTMNQILNILESENVMFCSSPNCEYTPTEIVDIERLVSCTSTSTMFRSIDRHPSHTYDDTFGSTESEVVALRNTM